MVSGCPRHFKMYRRECRKDKGGCGEFFDSETKYRQICDKCKANSQSARWGK